MPLHETTMAKRTSNDFKARPVINRRERDTLLAALRLWQAKQDGKRPRFLRATAEDFGPALSSEEIDDLCDRLNYISKSR